MAFEWSVSAKQETSPIPCPQCGIALLRQTHYFCATCGWNRTNLEKGWRSTMRFTVVLGTVFIPLVVVLEGFNTNWPFAILLGIFPLSFIFGIVYLYQRAALQDLAKATPSEKSGAALPNRLAPDLKFLETRIPGMHIFIGAAILVGGALMIWGVEWPAKFVPIALTAAFLTLCAHAFHKERAILTNRELAIGKVVKRVLRPGKSRVSMITYTFKDGMGNELRNTAQDFSLVYEAEMNVPVFYDRNQPARNLPVSGFLVYKLLPRVQLRT